jgi:cation/acetate symporter
MTTFQWTMLFVVLTFGLYLFIAWLSRVKDTTGFYVAGRGVPAAANGMATGADWMSAASFISMAGLVSTMGYAGGVYLMGWTGGYVLLALCLAPYLRKFGHFTVPDFVGDRFEGGITLRDTSTPSRQLFQRILNSPARIVAVVCAIFVSFTYVAGQMKGVGVVFSRFLEVPLSYGVIIGMVIVFIYATLGGMKGITWTQVAQYWVLITAFLIAAFTISFKLTGQALPQIGLGSEVKSTIDQSTPYMLEKLNQIHADLGFNSYTDTFVGGWDKINVFCVALALMAGTAGLPHVIVRFYTVKNVRAARWSAFWALFFIGLLYLNAPAIAGFARYYMIQSLQGTERYALNVGDTVTTTNGLTLTQTRDADGARHLKTAGDTPIASLPRQVRTEQSGRDLYVVRGEGQSYLSGLPSWFRNWEKTGLVLWLDDGDGKLRFSNNKDNELFNKSTLPTDMNWDNLIRNHDEWAASGGAKGADARAVLRNREDVDYGAVTGPDPDIIVLATPEMAELANWMIALVAAGGLAAALSTASGLLLVISSGVAHDLYARVLSPESSEAKRLMVGRVTIGLAVVVAGIFGIYPPGFVGQVVAFAFGLAASSFFPILLLGIFTKRVSTVPAIAGMIAGIGFTIFYIIACVYGGMATWTFGLFDSGIKPQGIGTIGMLINFAVTLALTPVFDRPNESIQQMVEAIREPEGAGAAIEIETATEH